VGGHEFLWLPSLSVCLSLFVCDCLFVCPPGKRCLFTWVFGDRLCTYQVSGVLTHTYCCSCWCNRSGVLCVPLVDTRTRSLERPPSRVASMVLHSRTWVFGDRLCTYQVSAVGTHTYCCSCWCNRSGVLCVPLVDTRTRSLERPL
jgi:hypothetical protein